MKIPENKQNARDWPTNNKLGQGFMARHDKLLMQSKHGYCMNHIRLKDLTKDNVQTMYELIYEGIKKAKVAVDLSEDER